MDIGNDAYGVKQNNQRFPDSGQGIGLLCSTHQSFKHFVLLRVGSWGKGQSLFNHLKVDSQKNMLLDFQN